MEWKTLLAYSTGATGAFRPQGSISSVMSGSGGCANTTTVRPHT
jgi:hypothetical protein